MAEKTKKQQVANDDVSAKSRELYNAAPVHESEDSFFLDIPCDACNETGVTVSASGTSKRCKKCFGSGFVVTKHGMFVLAKGAIIRTFLDRHLANASKIMGRPPQASPVAAPVVDTKINPTVTAPPTRRKG